MKIEIYMNDEIMEENVSVQIEISENQKKWKKRTNEDKY